MRTHSTVNGGTRSMPENEAVVTRVVVVQGELVRATNGQWMTQPPTRCPNGHPLGPNEVLVGRQACLGHGGGHTTWTCRACDQTVYGPPLNTHCTALEGRSDVGAGGSQRWTRGFGRRVFRGYATAPTRTAARDSTNPICSLRQRT